ncbi:MAG TPA: hypothetical protein VFP36_13295 [Usitatibacter sp.]|nr:hypothetical protein [Usitatibacter sp.]
MSLEPPARPISNSQLAEQLCAWSPNLREALRAHHVRYGTLIPHFFMRDVLARVERCGPAFCDPGANERGELEAILAVLERGVSRGDRETRNVIALSFLDDAKEQPFFATLRPLLGPSLQAQLRAP